MSSDQRRLAMWRMSDEELRPIALGTSERSSFEQRLANRIMVARGHRLHQVNHKATLAWLFAIIAAFGAATAASFRWPSYWPYFAAGFGLLLVARIVLTVVGALRGTQGTRDPVWTPETYHELVETMRRELELASAVSSDSDGGPELAMYITSCVIPSTDVGPRLARFYFMYEREGVPIVLEMKSGERFGDTLVPHVMHRAHISDVDDLDKIELPDPEYLYRRWHRSAERLLDALDELARAEQSQESEETMLRAAVGMARAAQILGETEHPRVAELGPFAETINALGHPTEDGYRDRVQALRDQHLALAPTSRRL